MQSYKVKLPNGQIEQASNQVELVDIAIECLGQSLVWHAAAQAFDLSPSDEEVMEYVASNIEELLWDMGCEVSGGLS